MRRVACIALPQIRVEIAREREGRQGEGKSIPPFAVVIARPGGTIRTERDVLGNTRLDVVSREACASGVRMGHTVAAARAKCASLGVRVVAESAVRTGLARVAEVALAFGPRTEFDVVTDVVSGRDRRMRAPARGERELGQALEEPRARVGARMSGVDCRRTTHRSGGRALRTGPRRGSTQRARRSGRQGGRGDAGAPRRSARSGRRRPGSRRLVERPGPAHVR